MAQQVQPHGSVQGRAILSDTGAPAAGAFVSLLPAAQPQTLPEAGEYIVHEQVHRGDLHATVSADGLFTIDNVPPGDYTVLTYKPGYVSQDAEELQDTHSSDSIEKVRITAGESANVNLALQRGGRIEGQVRIDSGMPLPSASTALNTVAVNVEMETAAGKFVRFGGAAHTDAAGHYSTDELPPGRYIVFAAFPPMMIPTTHGLSSGSGRLVFASGVLRPSRARVVELSKQATLGGVDIVVPTENLHRITGRLIDSAGKAVTECFVRLYPEGEPELPLATPPDRNGNFVFTDLPDDHYIVSFRCDPVTRFLGLTSDGTGIRMLLEKQPFSPAKINVQVSGQDPPALLLRVQPTS
jgi:hypothetical protein